MTDKNESTTHPDADAKEESTDSMKEMMENCGCDCGSMMARFFQRNADGEAADEKGAKNGCC